jgi:hypothetical protein
VHPKVRHGFRILRTVISLLILATVLENALAWHCEILNPISTPVPQPQERKSATNNIKDYARPEDDTYLSFPEWYIVWSYQEKADFQQSNLPSGFPYFSAVQQYWRSYHCIGRLAKGKYPINYGEEVMLIVIGASFSAEYNVKGTYENTIGRLSEHFAHNQLTDEDHYAYQVARQYADFVKIRPFYEFKFVREVPGLYTQNSWFGPHFLRKWERKLFLTFDYLAEGFYCWLIEKLTHATYGHEPDRTYAWVEDLNDSLVSETPHMKLVKRIEPRAAILDIPRYQEFTNIATTLSQHEVHFVEIAGNSQISISVIAPDNWHLDPTSPAKPLFALPILTRPNQQRVILNCPVTNLDTVLRQLTSSSNSSITLEHVYDY